MTSPSHVEVLEQLAKELREHGYMGWHRIEALNAAIALMRAPVGDGVAVTALREIYETGMYPEGHTLAGEHAYKGEHHADCIGIAERALAAMQATGGGE